MEKQYSQLCNDIYDAGIRKGMVLMVHSSFRSLGLTEGTPDMVIRAFQEILTPDGTLFMPALTWANVTRDNPVFSVLDTPCCVGAIPEAFRHCSGVTRSVNPVHSVCAWGRLAEELTRDHCLDTCSMGEHSPYRLLPQYNGKILMLGCGLRPNTFMHGVEEAAQAPYRAIHSRILYHITDADGTKRDFLGTLPNMNHLIQRYDRVEQLLTPPALQQFDILKAHCHLMDAAALMDKGVAAIRHSPYFFVDTENSCKVPVGNGPK